MLLLRGAADARSMLSLQRAIGNRAVGELFGRRPRLTVGPATDAHEREADRVAAGIVQRLRAADTQPLAERQVPRIQAAVPFPSGQDLFFGRRVADPAPPTGDQLVADEIASTPNGKLQRRFGFEIELPMLLTEEEDSQVTSLADGTDLDMPDLPMDPGLRNHETHLVDFPNCYVNVDHSRTLNKLFDTDLDQYAADQALDANATASLKAVTGQLMPSGASIVEVVTTPWDESSLTRPQAQARVRSVVGKVTQMFDAIDGDRAAHANGYRLGSDAPNASVFQPRLGYFHATYGVKLSQIPRLFEQTTQQKSSMKKYARRNVPEGEHARNVELTSRSVPAARSAMKEIKRLWPRIVVPRKILPDTSKIALSSAAEKDFLGLLTLLANYFLLMSTNSGGDDLAKKLVGMHYYKSDLYDVVNQLPGEVRDPLRNATSTLLDDVINVICGAVGVDATNRMNGALGGYTVRGYLRQIFRGQYGVIQFQGADKLDASGNTFRDPVLAGSINPWSSKLGPEQIGPAGNQGLGVVLENRHLEYLNPEYGSLVDQQQGTMRDEVIQYGPPKAGADARTAQQRAMYDSIGAREEGPARRPIGEWETMMMNVYDMIKAINSRR